jgi:hypothetical protein
MHDDWLKDAALADVVGKLVERSFRELSAWVVRVFVDQRDVHQKRLAGGHGLGVEQNLLVRAGRLGTPPPC